MVASNAAVALKVKSGRSSTISKKYVLGLGKTRTRLKGTKMSENFRVGGVQNVSKRIDPGPKMLENHTKQVKCPKCLKNVRNF